MNSAKKLIKIVSLTLVFVMCAMSVAYAAPHGGPGPGHGRYDHGRHHHWSRGDHLAIGLGIGALLGAAIASDSNASKAAAAEKSATKEDLRDMVEDEAQTAASLVAQNGVAGAAEHLKTAWEEQGKRTEIKERELSTTLRVTGFSDDVELVYYFDRDREQVTATAAMDKKDLKEEYTARFEQPEVSSQYYIGLELADKHHTSGYPLVERVEEGTYADLCKISAGDQLVSIGGKSLKYISNDEVGKIIAQCARSGQLTEIVYRHNGQEYNTKVRL